MIVVLSGSIFSPSGVKRWPKNLIEAEQNHNLSLDILYPLLANCWRKGSM